MSCIRKYGHPDLFITTTTNPNWPEIKNSLLPGQDPQDHPDIVARVFRLKVQKLLDMLKSEMVFGKPQAWLYSIKWQKHGLPHCHLLLWLSAEQRIAFVQKSLTLLWILNSIKLSCPTWCMDPVVALVPIPLACRTATVAKGIPSST